MIELKQKIVLIEETTLLEMNLEAGPKVGGKQVGSLSVGDTGLIDPITDCQGIRNQKWKYLYEDETKLHVKLLSDKAINDIVQSIKSDTFHYKLNTDMQLTIKRDDSWSMSYIKYIR